MASEDEQALQAEDYAALDSENSAYMEAIQACMDGTHLAAGALDQIPTAEPAGDSSGDQSLSFSGQENAFLLVVRGSVRLIEQSASPFLC